MKVVLAVLVLMSVAMVAQTGVTSLRQQHLECLAAMKVLYSGKCYNLLEQGPCDPGSRLTLDQTVLPAISVACTPCKCCHELRAVWWPGDGTCHHRSKDDIKLCGGPSTGTYLDEDLFGDGACLCWPGYARTSDQDSEPCYALYHQGPCSKGQIFAAVKPEDGGKPECIRDPCARENSDSSNSTSAMAPDGKCYPLGSRGPCPEESSFNVHKATLRPQCIDRINNIVVLPCVSGATDASGNCRKVVQPQNARIHGLALINAAKTKRRVKFVNLA